MSRGRTTTVAGLAALLLLVGAPIAHGAETIAAAARPAPPLGATPVDAAALAGQRGGTDATSPSEMRLSGVVGNNRASNLVTGNNTITDGAFSGVSGVPLIVQNSGNNVLIQSATIINVQLK